MVTPWFFVGSYLVLTVFQMRAGVAVVGVCVPFRLLLLQTCLIGDEDSELCLELLGGLDIPSAAVSTSLQHLQNQTQIKNSAPKYTQVLVKGPGSCLLPPGGGSLPF